MPNPGIIFLVLGQGPCLNPIKLYTKLKPWSGTILRFYANNSINGEPPYQTDGNRQFDLELISMTRSSVALTEYQGILVSTNIPAPI